MTTLTLIRVQHDATARRGRGLVRLLSDLAARADKPVPVVAQCPNHCGAFFNVAVDLNTPADPTVLRLPDNCWKCGHSLQEYETIRALIAKARYYRETTTPGGAA